MKYFIAGLLIAILALLAWFFFFKPDPCFTVNKLSRQRQEAAALFNERFPLIGSASPASDKEIKAGFACARSLK